MLMNNKKYEGVLVRASLGKFMSLKLSPDVIMQIMIDILHRYGYYSICSGYHSAS